MMSDLPEICIVHQATDFPLLDFLEVKGKDRIPT